MSQALREIVSIFGRLGVLGFGGPIATMAMMEEETVRKRSWVTPAQFSEIYSVCKVLPGPNATQLAIYLGMHRAGRLGGFLAGFTFVLPSFLLVLGIAILYEHFQNLADRSWVFPAMQAAALAVIVFSTEQLARPYAKRRDAILIAAASFAVVSYRMSLEPWIILFFGIIGARRALGDAKKGNALGVTGAGILGSRLSLDAGTALAAGTTATVVTGLAALPSLFWTCFKAGAFVFGTGLAIVPLLEGDFVQRHQWLTHSEFMNALAVGQITPGPIVITVTFVGYKVAGILGSILATIAIFLAPFINMLFIVPRIWDRISRTPAAQGFASYAMPAVIGSIIGASLKLAYLTLDRAWLFVVFVSAIFAIWRFRLSAWKLIPLCGIAGGIYQFFRG